MQKSDKCLFVFIFSFLWLLFIGFSHKYKTKSDKRLFVLLSPFFICFFVAFKSRNAKTYSLCIFLSFISSIKAKRCQFPPRLALFIPLLHTNTSLKAHSKHPLVHHCIIHVTHDRKEPKLPPFTTYLTLLQDTQGYLT